MKAKSQIGTIAAICVLGAGLAFVFQNCGAPADDAFSAPGEKVQTKAETVSMLNAKIKSLSAKDLTCTTDDDCQPLALGAKPCGGPSEYTVISRHNVEGTQIAQLAEQLRTVAQALNQESGAISTCDMVMPPEYHCVSSTCQQ